MSLAHHLIELRKRLLLSLIGIAICMVPAWLAYPTLATWLFAPLSTLTTPPSSPPTLFPPPTTPLSSGANFTSVTAPFSTQLFFSAWAGFILSSPWWMTQLWLYIAPALHRREKKAFLCALAPSALLFTGGCTLGTIFLPRAVETLLSIAPQSATTLIDAQTYLRFATTLIVAFGVSFLFPVGIIIAHSLHLLSVRRLIHSWRWSTLACFTIAAIINPLPDPWSMILQAIVLMALLWIAIAICALRERYRRLPRQTSARLKRSGGAS